MVYKDIDRKREYSRKRNRIIQIIYWDIYCTTCKKYVNNTPTNNTAMNRFEIRCPECNRILAFNNEDINDRKEHIPFSVVKI